MVRGVKKNILKQKKHSAPASEDEFVTAVREAKAMSGYTELSFVKLLQSLSCDDLKRMKSYFEHDKTVIAKKMETVVEYSSSMKSLMKVHDFMGDMIEKGRTLIHDAIVNDVSAKNSKGEFKSSDIIKFIEMRIAVKESEMEV